MNYYYIENLTDAELDALKKELVDVVDNLDNGEYVAVYNEYADTNRYERIYENNEYVINDLFGEDCTPWDALDALAGGYVTTDPYCMYNGNGLLESGECPRYMACVESEKLADFIIHESNDFEYDDIAEVLEKYDEIGKKHFDEEE